MPLPSRRPAVRPARVLAAAVVLALALTGCAGRNAVDQAAESGPGKAQAAQIALTSVPAGQRGAPVTLTGTLLDGTAFDLSAYAGKVVVINFWGSWCGPCQGEAENLEQVFQSTRSQGVQFLGVDIKDTATAARGFERRHGITYPSLSDQAGRAALQVGSLPPVATPTTIVLDRRHRPAARFSGPLLPEDLQPVVEAIAREGAA